MTDAARLGFYRDPAGTLFVDVADLVVWCLGYAQHLQATGNDAGAQAVAGVGNTLADILGEQTPDPEMN